MREDYFKKKIYIKKTLDGIKDSDDAPELFETEIFISKPNRLLIIATQIKGNDRYEIEIPGKRLRPLLK